MKPHLMYLRSGHDGWTLFLPAPGRDGLSGQSHSEADDAETASHGKPITFGPFEPYECGAVLQAIRDAMHPDPSGTAHLVIGLASHDCLAATVSTEQLPLGRTRAKQLDEALGYRLEEKLPIAIEDYAVDFAGEGINRLGVASPLRPLRQLVHALEDAGHIVETILPAAFLQAQSLIQQLEPDTYCGLLWRETQWPASADTDPAHEAGGVQLILLRDRIPVCWRCLSSSADTRQHQLGLEQSVHPLPADWHATASLHAELATVTQSSRIAALPALGIESECDAAACMVKGSITPWVNLRRGALSPRHAWRRLRLPTSVAIAAAMVLLCCLMAIGLLRAHQYQQIADAFDEQADRAFLDAMPGQRVPASPQRRLEGQLKQLRGERGLAGDHDTLVSKAPALFLLEQALSRLPEQQRFVITDLRIESDQIRLTGHARSHGEADQIAGSLRTDNRFTVDPPSTENLPDGGVRFSLRASLNPERSDQNRPTPGNSPPTETDGPASVAQRTSRSTRP